MTPARWREPVSRPHGPRPGPSFCSDCDEVWPWNLKPLMDALGGCPACSSVYRRLPDRQLVEDRMLTPADATALLEALGVAVRVVSAPTA